MLSIGGEDVQTAAAAVRLHHGDLRQLVLNVRNASSVPSGESRGSIASAGPASITPDQTSCAGVRPACQTAAPAAINKAAAPTMTHGSMLRRFVADANTGCSSATGASSISATPMSGSSGADVTGLGGSGPGGAGWVFLTGGTWA